MSTDRRHRLCMVARRKLLVSIVVGAIVLLVASAALAENYQYRFTRADQALAARIVLNRSDLPALQSKDWTGGAVKPDLSPDPVRCPGYYTPKRSDLVVTGTKEADYVFRGGPELDSYATVLRSAAMVEADWRRGTLSSFLKCFRAKWATLPIGKGSRILSAARLPLPRFGTHSIAYRVVVADTSSGRRVAIDSVEITHGRIEVETDQIFPASSAGDLAALANADRQLASLVALKLAATG